MDKQKRDELITEYLQKIYAFSIRKAYSYDEAEEICAEITKEVYVSLLKSEEIINIEGYIWRISENTYSKYVSSKKRHEGISIDGISLPFFDEYSFDNSDDMIKRLRCEIAFLTEKRRKIVYRFYYENKSISDISKEMSLPEGNVKWHLNKSRNELKGRLNMERKIGKLGLSPITAEGFGHNGNPGTNGGTEYYLGDKLNLNIVYSVYYSPKTKKEIAEELGLTLIFVEDKINFLEDNGFLVKTKGDKYTTYVRFNAEQYSLELQENMLRSQLNIAEILTTEYVPLVREAIHDIKDVYIPGNNRELFEAAAIFYGITNKCLIKSSKDISKYIVKTTAGGEFTAQVYINSRRADPEYKAALKLPSYYACGDMIRESNKYPSVYSWSIDSRYSSRKGAWKNNLYSDYEYLYEFITGEICDNAANAEKISRLKEREFLTDNNKVNIMIIKGKADEFFKMIPVLCDNIKKKFADKALDIAMNTAKNYPPQMQDLIISEITQGFISKEVALMTMDILYKNGTFRPLTDNEKVTSNLLMFSDTLPETI